MRGEICALFVFATYVLSVSGSTAHGQCVRVTADNNLEQKIIAETARVNRVLSPSNSGLKFFCFTRTGSTHAFIRGKSVGIRFSIKDWNDSYAYFGASPKERSLAMAKGALANLWIFGHEMGHVMSYLYKYRKSAWLFLHGHEGTLAQQRRFLGRVAMVMKSGFANEIYSDCFGGASVGISFGRSPRRIQAAAMGSVVTRAISVASKNRHGRTHGNMSERLAASSSGLLFGQRLSKAGIAHLMQPLARRGGLSNPVMALHKVNQYCTSIAHHIYQRKKAEGFNTTP